MKKFLLELLDFLHQVVTFPQPVYYDPCYFVGIKHKNITASGPSGLSHNLNPSGRDSSPLVRQKDSMKNQYYLKQGDVYFVFGTGFGTTDKAKASKLTADDLACVERLGFKGEKVPVPVSFAVNYIRADDLDAAGNVQPNKRNPSKRRFATRAEAYQHGSRFNFRVKNAGDKPGTAGHIGFYVTESTDPVNAVINWETGLTNPLA